jgi:hypothetical protein
MAVPAMVLRSPLNRLVQSFTVRESRRGALSAPGASFRQRPAALLPEQPLPAIGAQQPGDDLEDATWEDAEWQ